GSEIVINTVSVDGNMSVGKMIAGNMIVDRIKMNPIASTKTAVIVVSAEVTEKPAQPTNSCSIM
ncbi:2220_t:CDS:2, partial [Rhizophagus irregularis]